MSRLEKKECFQRQRGTLPGKGVTAILNVQPPHRDSKYLSKNKKAKLSTQFRSPKLMEWKGEIDKSVIAVGNVNFCLSNGQKSKQEASENKEDLRNTETPLDPVDIYATLHPIL